jgi:hypothetical protein
MRIIGYLDTKEYKTTVFKHETKFLVKFETALFEQTYKFRETEQLQTLEDIKKLVDIDFLVGVEDRFGFMYRDSNEMLGRYIADQEEEWEEII